MILSQKGSHFEKQGFLLKSAIYPFVGTLKKKKNAM
jgi:hypothetical protein